VISNNAPSTHPVPAALEREFGWARGHDGNQYHSRRPNTPAHDDARGGDPADVCAGTPERTAFYDGTVISWA
jgi:hypothetical protein